MGLNPMANEDGNEKSSGETGVTAVSMSRQERWGLCCIHAMSAENWGKKFQYYDLDILYQIGYPHY